VIKPGVQFPLQKIQEAANEKAERSSFGTFRCNTWNFPDLAYGTPQAMSQDLNKPELVNIKGTVKADGDKITFVSDETGKSYRGNVKLVVQDHSKKRMINVNFAVVIVLNETQSPEFVHEKVDAGPGCANHLRQRFLRYFRKHRFRLARGAIARKQQQSACQAFLAGVEELVDQIFFDPEVPRQHKCDEAVGELMFVVEHTNHLVLLKDKHSG
jgi:hypothetical protein